MEKNTTSGGIPKCKAGAQHRPQVEIKEGLKMMLEEEDNIDGEGEDYNVKPKSFCR